MHEGKCIICDNLSEWNSESRRCECVPPTYLIEGRCQFCSANSRYDETNQSCRCRGGYTKFGMVCRKARLSDPFINFEITGL